MARVLTLTGWGQNVDALSSLYAGSESVDYFTHGVSGDTRIYDAVIGWSLGGAVAISALAEERIKAKRLILIATPYQFLQSGDYSFGMEQATFQQFCDSYAQNAEDTLGRFQRLMVKGDSTLSKTRIPYFQHEKLG